MLDAKFDAILRRYLPFISAADVIAEDTSLRDYGLDSMATVELMSDLESEYRIRFVDDLLSLETFATPGRIWASISQMTAPAE
ncbi:acyl carrier protein [Streptomyces luteolifulvus]|jgi:acyl carrier protein|uniref:Acyl carrier protein n=1 Tax=Streptomyces luteolifulvus TaxID=2615112 RepID=A0A6H9UYI7_9ACTN|nr:MULTISPECIES: phosphopantetheine-binding protein [Streptomyces]KAB1145063.1 acyl carrier protein [Streptomyces luteolifulvus]MXM68955.1 acyl carrier protein [Streptomyces sp. HUCO-GS316]